MTKNLLPYKNILLVAIAMLFINAAPDVNNYTLAAGYTVTINGTSNLHDWIEKVENVSGTGAVSWNSDGSFDLNTMTIKMEVRSIKSDQGSIMNNNTYKALKADDHPQIIFTIRVPVKSIQASVKKEISVMGNLSIAGKMNPVNMQVKVFMQENGKLAFEGSKQIKMTDFDVEPPQAFFGTLKTGNDITLNFITSFNLIPNP